MIEQHVFWLLSVLMSLLVISFLVMDTDEW